MKLAKVKFEMEIPESWDMHEVQRFLKTLRSDLYDKPSPKDITSLEIRIESKKKMKEEQIIK